MFSHLLARPWWVNLLILIPVVLYLVSRNARIPLTRTQLFMLALFGVALGFVEAAAVVYLRAWGGPRLFEFPVHLLHLERYQEIATLVMLGTIAFLVGQRMKDRAIAFLLAFAFLDLSYYVSLRLTIGWPGSLADRDLLFLLPVPWVAQVWFPILVSGLTAAVIWKQS